MTNFTKSLCKISIPVTLQCQARNVVRWSNNVKSLWRKGQSVQAKNIYEKQYVVAASN